LLPCSALHSAACCVCLEATAAPLRRKKYEKEQTHVILYTFSSTRSFI
jgi:hypothetical protein